MPRPDHPDWLSVHPRRVLKRHGLWAASRRGQNFLVSLAAMERIVNSAGLRQQEVVLEVGTGLGRMTALLAEEAAQVVSVEVDAGLHRIAEENLADFDNVTLLPCDFLESKHSIRPAVTEAVRTALSGRECPLKVVSNLPYSISSPAVINLLEWDPAPGEMYLTLQREVADRMTAAPGSGDYGPLTVFVDYWAAAELLFTLGRRDFWPVPEVTSAFVRLIRRPARRRDCGYEAFAQSVRDLFTFRRKTVRKALKLAVGAQQAERVLQCCELDGRRRVEELSVADFEAIAGACPDPQSED